MWKSIHAINALHKQQEGVTGGSKRKRTTSEDGDELDGLLAKRLMTDPHLSSYQQVSTILCKVHFIIGTILYATCFLAPDIKSNIPFPFELFRIISTLQ